MAAQKLAHSGQSIPFEISEAHSRLRLASKALDGFMCLISGYDGSSELDAEQLTCLLSPVSGEISAALDELNQLVGAEK